MSCKSGEYITIDQFCNACPQDEKGCDGYQDLYPSIYKNCMRCDFSKTLPTSDVNTQTIVITVVCAVALLCMIAILVYKCKQWWTPNNTSGNDESNTTIEPAENHDDSSNMYGQGNDHHLPYQSVSFGEENTDNANGLVQLDNSAQLSLDKPNANEQSRETQELLECASN